MSAYADTSFLVSLYTPDANSVDAARKMAAYPQVILITPLAELELANALELRLFRKELRTTEVKAAQSAIRKDLADAVYQPIPMPVGVFERARSISKRRTARLGTRTLDVLHVAAALELKAQDFLTFDISPTSTVAGGFLPVSGNKAIIFNSGF